MDHPKAAAVFLLALTGGCLWCRNAPVPERAEPEVREGKVYAKVIRVSRADGQAFIAAGRNHGVIEGVSFDVFREGRLVGQVRVTSVWDEECGGWIVGEFAPLRTGDRAVAPLRPGAVGERDPGDATPAPVADEPGTIRTKLAAVRAEAGHVILEAGSDGGVAAGMVFHVYRDSIFVGRVKVTLVQPKVAGARVLERRAVLAPGLDAVYYPGEAEDADLPPVGSADEEAVIRKLRQTIADPDADEAEREAARQVLLKILERRKHRRGD
jgi:hypothetical protein